MKVISQLSQLPKNKKIVLTIGNFDGLHRGHLKILRKVAREAKKINALSAVVTFTQHPRKILKKQKNFGLLYFQDQKVSSIKRSNIDICLLVDFNDVRDLSKDEFLSAFVDPRRVAHVIVGYDFHFGKGRSGHFDDIKAYCKARKIRFNKVQAVRYKNESISSNRIRSLIEKGKFNDVRACLGRPYSLFGKVVHGAALGQKIGVPTANIQVETEIFPPDGVYRVSIRRIQKTPTDLLQRQGKVYDGLAYKGKKPSFVKKKGSDNIVEVFIFNFDADLYDSYLEIEFITFMRKPKKVTTLNALKELIHIDIQRSKKN